jgi:Emfourin
MNSRIHGVSVPALLAGAVILATVVGAAVAFALSSDGDSQTDAATVTPTTTDVPVTPTSPAPQATSTAVLATSVPPPATAAPAADVWSIDFDRTGGFAGMAQSLSVSSDGQVRYEDKRANRVETGTLSAADLGELRSLIDSSGFFSQAPKQDAPCADCFNLAITVTLNGQSYRVEAVDIAVDAALKPLLDKLTSLLQDGLSQ